MPSSSLEVVGFTLGGCQASAVAPCRALWGSLLGSCLVHSGGGRGHVGSLLLSLWGCLAPACCLELRVAVVCCCHVVLLFRAASVSALGLSLCCAGVAAACWCRAVTLLLAASAVAPCRGVAYPRFKRIQPSARFPFLAKTDFQKTLLSRTLVQRTGA